MVNAMPRTKGKGRTPRTTVNVPRPLYEAVKALVESGHAIQGYVSVDDFIRDTLRRRLEELRPAR
jgi:Arc/MetJ-type ribon-helix-helix transcriptional regulator